MQRSKTPTVTAPPSGSSIPQSAARGVPLELPWNVLLPILMASIPKDVTARADFLDALVTVLPATHPEYAGIREARSHLDMHIIAQRELCLGIARGDDAAVVRGSGRLGDTPMERGAGQAKGGRR